MTEPAQNLPAPVTEAPVAPAGPSFDDVIEQVFGPSEPAPANDVTGGTPAPAANDTDPPKKADEATPAKEDRVAARIVAAKRAEAKTAAERRDLITLRETQERRQAELDAREKRLRLVEEDPIRAFEELKIDPKTFLEKLSGEYKPENVVAKKADALEAKVAELEKRLADKDTAAQREAASIKADTAWKEAATSFISHVGEKADAYPHLTEEFTEDQATDLAFTVLTEVVGADERGKPLTRSEAYFREHGVYPDHEVIAEYLDGIAKARVEARTKSAWRKRGDSATQARQAPIGNSQAVPPGRGTSPRTLTSREASQRTAPPARKGGPVWTAADQDEADEAALRLIEEAMRRTG